jgi:MFS family permease
MTNVSASDEFSRRMTGEERTVIFASSLGTVFEWYDFYLYGSLAAIISREFFSGVNPTAGYIFALLAFAAGFAVRPFGAMVFGRIGDLVGRKVRYSQVRGSPFRPLLSRWLYARGREPGR